MATLRELKNRRAYAVQAAILARTAEEKAAAILDMDKTAVAIKEREADLKAVWRGTHRDFRGTDKACKSIMIFRTGVGTCIVPLASLTAEEVASRLPKKGA